MQESHVLIVEDNADLAQSLRRVLESRTDVRYFVEAAGCFADGAGRLKAGGIDAVLLDLKLPDMPPGIPVISAIKAAAPDIGIVVLTGWAYEDFEKEAKAAGADEFLLKPAQPKDVSLKLQLAILHRKDAKSRHAIEKHLADMADIIARLEQRFDGATE